MLNITASDGTPSTPSTWPPSTVPAVNDAPALADTVLTLTVSEDAPAPVGAAGALLSAFTGGISDIDAGAAKGIAISAIDQGFGLWYYSIDGGTTWTLVGTVNATSALLLADNPQTRLYFQPNANFNGGVRHRAHLPGLGPDRGRRARHQGQPDAHRRPLPPFPPPPTPLR